MKEGRGEGTKKSGRREKKRKRRRGRRKKKDDGILTKKADVQFVECVF